jgi:type II secretory pathway pseudopilin PulG
MFMMLRNKNKGDTIVEVLLASVLLSIVLAGAYSLSSRATRLNQSAYERSRATNLVQEQAELLKSIKNTGSSEWNNVTLLIQPEEFFYNCRNTGLVTAKPAISGPTYAGFFYLDDDDEGNIVVNDGAVKTTDDIYHTWVARSDQYIGNGHYDFSIYTCWEGLGSSGNQLSGAVVRLEI